MSHQPYIKTGRDFVFPDYKPRYPRKPSFKIDHYKLFINIDPDDKRLDGEAYITFADGCTSASLDAVDFEMLEISGAVESSYDGKNIYVRLNPTIKNTVKIVYRVWPRTGVHFIPSSKSNGFPSIWSHGEPEYHRNWMPIYDYPNMKFTSELVVTVPKPLEVVSNGELVRKEESPDGRNVWHWLMDKPHTSYLISFVAGVFDREEEMFDGVKLEYYVPRGMKQYVKNSFSKTGDMMRFFSQYFMFPYPFKSYRQVCVPEFVVGGMENTTATTLTDLTLHDDIAHMDFSSDPLVAHELAHQWFGDLVTCRDWSHIWLNESFATYLENLYLRHDKGRDEFLYELYNDLQSYLDEYRRRYSRPVVYRVYKYPEELFDRHAYPKGGLVLHTLSNIVGEENFRKALNLFLKRHSFSNADTEDFRKALEEVSGIPLEQLFEQLVYSSGHPSIKAAYSWDADSRMLKISLKQVQGDDSPETYGLELEVRVSTSDETLVKKISLEEREVTLYLPLKERPGHVCIDPELKLLRVVEVERPLEELLKAVERCENVVCRLEMVESLAKAGGRRAVEVLERVVRQDRFWGVSYRAAKALGDIGSEDAKKALIRLEKSVHHPKIRRGIVEAMGIFEKDKEVFDVLVKVIENASESYYVRQSACISLGRLKLVEALPVLTEASKTSSHAHVIHSGAVQGLAETGFDEAFKFVVERVNQEYPTPVRVAATVSLAKFPGKKEVYEILEKLSEDDSERVRHAVVAAARELLDPRLLQILDKMAEKDLNERVRRTAREVVKRIRDNLERGVEYKALREEVEKMKEENRRILDKIYRIEGKT
ncbi:MAG: M1 family aminopeptidase [Candidatus Caldarchaeum sp.]|nr:M1 family aminopeptidase [Candidatus Caldarchaeum sp.]MDW8434978.1 M1 family aminopeptidase [Candidatus Caldarchaeum sp.]